MKPSWKDAPEWAMWLISIGANAAYWCEYKPEWQDGCFRPYFGRKKYAGVVDAPCCETPPGGGEMSATTKISWCGSTWNPVAGCDAVSPGCDSCFARAMSRRFNGGDFTVQLHPAVKRFVSAGPLLGPVRLPVFTMVKHETKERYLSANLDWVICGGETGPGARPMNPDWARSLRDQCGDAGVPFFFKQMGGRLEIPDDPNIREFPR